MSGGSHVTSLQGLESGLEPSWLTGLSPSSVGGGVLPLEDSAHPEVCV